MGEATVRKLEIDLEWYNDDVFLETSIQESKELFNSFTEKGLIVEGEFEQDHWVLYRNKEELKTSNLKFNDISFEHIKTMLKCWAINLLTEFKTEHCQYSLKQVKEVVRITDGFSENKVNVLCEKLESLTGTAYNYMLFQTYNFLEYSDLEQKELYLNELNNFSLDREKRTRKLPHFKDTLIFDWVLNDFYEKESSNDLKLYYYPILIWWKLTNIIPMRTAEFTSIKRECLSSNNGKYFITIPRKKQKGGFHRDKLEVINKIEINKDIFILISNYIEQSESYGKTETLISYKNYTCFRNENEKTEGSVGQYNRNQNRFNAGNFKYLLNRFYNHIVSEKYGFVELERVRPMDTRHFAFCNLMLQGINMLSIARIGGHRTLLAQCHYQNHLETFSESYVYQLTQLNKLRNIGYAHADFRQTETYDELKNKADLLKIIGTEGYEFMEPVEDGYCTDKEMRCETDICLFCSKFIIKKEQLENPHVQKRLVNLSNRYNDKIKLTVKTMVHVSKKMGFDFENNINTIPQEETELKQKAKELEQYMNQKATIDSFLWDIDENNI